MKCSLNIVKYMIIMGIALNVPLMTYAKCSDHSHKQKKHHRCEVCRKGDKGDRGKKGKTGQEGDEGDPGEIGQRGTTGNTGSQGIPGLPGTPALLFGETCYSYKNKTLDAGDAVFFDNCTIPGVPFVPGTDTIRIPKDGLVTVICTIRGSTVDPSDPAYFEILHNGNPVANSPVNSQFDGNSPNALIIALPVLAGDELQLVSINNGVSLVELLPANNANCLIIESPIP